MTSPTPHHFYGGRSARSNEVHPFDETDFPSLVKSIYFRPVPIGVTKAEFLAMPKDARDAAKNGPYVTAASFNPDTPTRKRDHARSIELLFLDLDEDENTTHLAREIASVPETALSALAPFNCLVHHTANSTPHAPRLRVIVEAASLPLDAHRAAVALVLRRLGLPDQFKGAVESNNCVLPMFRPVMFKGENDSPVIAHRIDGRAVTLEDIGDAGEEGNLLPEGDDTYAATWDDALGDLDQLPVQGMTVDMMRPAVMKLDPDMEYRPWLDVAAALRHQFRTEDEARQAFDLFDEWSSAGAKYKGRKETLFKWKSFRPDAGKRRSVTIRTLIKRAKEAGWEPATIHVELKQSFAEWLKSTEVEVVSATGCARILATPEITPLQEAEYIKDLLHHLRGAGKRIGEADLRKEMSRLRSVERKEKADEGTTELWLQPFVYDSAADRFIHTCNTTEVVMSPAAFDRTFGHKMLEIEAGAEGGIPTNGKPKVDATTHALNVRKIPTVIGGIYAPEIDDAVITPENKIIKVTTHKLNTYARHLIPPLEADPEKVAKVAKWWRIHLETLIGDKQTADYVHWFCAALVQHPGRKIPWAILFQSAEGVGKTLLSELIGAAIAQENVSIVEPSSLASGAWNEWAANVQLIVFEEIKVPGHARIETMNRLKTILTNENIQVVQKFKDSRKARNVANVLAFTNFKDSIHLSESSRRWLVIWSPIQTKQQVAALHASGHFTKVAVIKKHGGALRKHLMDTVIPDDFPWDGPPPETAYTRLTINEGKNVLQREIEDMIANPGEPLVCCDVIDLAHLDDSTYALAKNNHPARHYLQILGYEPYGEGKFDINGHRTEVWWHAGNFDMSECKTPDEVLAERRAGMGDMSI